MMFSLLALASAACYGAADFIGGLVSRRADTAAVVVVSQVAGLLMIAVALPLLPPATPAAEDWVWGAAAGVAGGTGVALLYRALALGTMAVVAPITAVCAVAVPVIAALALGERPGVQAGAGMAIALLAIVLVSQSSSPASVNSTPTARHAIGLALASGVAIGVFFLALARTSASAGLWPLVAARAATIMLFGTWVAAAGRGIAIPRDAWLTVCVGGLLDMTANLLYLLATRAGPLTLVVTLSSLYPASTVLLARLVLGERLSARQSLGVASALIAILLIVSA
jgi:uncharacterized membrane protein